jgi:hypothetical protein
MDRLDRCNIVSRSPVFFPRDTLEILLDKLLSSRQSVAPTHEKIMAESVWSSAVPSSIVALYCAFIVALFARVPILVLLAAFVSSCRRELVTPDAYACLNVSVAVPTESRFLGLCVVKEREGQKKYQKELLTARGLRCRPHQNA